MLTQIEDNENDKYFFQGIKHKSFQPGKDSIKKNVVLYVSPINLCLDYNFSFLSCAYVRLTLMQHLEEFSTICVC